MVNEGRQPCIVTSLKHEARLKEFGPHEEPSYINSPEVYSNLVQFHSLQIFRSPPRDILERLQQLKLKHGRTLLRHWSSRSHRRPRAPSGSLHIERVFHAQRLQSLCRHSVRQVVQIEAVVAAGYQRPRDAGGVDKHRQRHADSRVQEVATLRVRNDRDRRKLVPTPRAVLGRNRKRGIAEKAVLIRLFFDG